jgi:hypothetical protein
MSKLLTDQELSKILSDIVEGTDVIDDWQVYHRFVGDLASLITEYCGGDVVMVSGDRSERVMAHIEHNNSVPPGGGVFKDYDTDVTVEEWSQENLTEGEKIE